MRLRDLTTPRLILRRGEDKMAYHVYRRWVHYLWVEKMWGHVNFNTLVAPRLTRALAWYHRKRYRLRDRWSRLRSRDT